jgi:hypothetical protein
MGKGLDILNGAAEALSKPKKAPKKEMSPFEHAMAQAKAAREEVGAPKSEAEEGVEDYVCPHCKAPKEYEGLPKKKSTFQSNTEDFVKGFK